MTAIRHWIVRVFPLIALASAITCLGLGSSQLAARMRMDPALEQQLRDRLIDKAALTKAQPDLLAKQIKAMPPARRGQPQIYSLSIAPGGSQAIFGREAAAVKDLFAGRLGAKAPSIILSNARKDLFKLPIASRENLDTVLSAIGKRMDPGRDLLLLYMTSHGGREAIVQTDLPDGTWLDPIDADFLAKSLDKAGIKRRIIIISACFAGSWIPALKSSDSIILTAATPYRPSFGCNDKLQYTNYGSAFIKGGLARGLSWSDSYAELQTTIADEERRMRLPASGPMADVGDRMQGVWNAPLAPLSGRRK